MTSTAKTQRRLRTMTARRPGHMRLRSVRRAVDRLGGVAFAPRYDESYRSVKIRYRKPKAVERAERSTTSTAVREAVRTFMPDLRQNRGGRS